MTSIIKAENLTTGYSNQILLNSVNFEVKQHDIFVIMGNSGCGKSSLLRVLTGLIPAKGGNVYIKETDITTATQQQKDDLMKTCGILYQSGALFSSMTLAENIALPLEQYSDYSKSTINELVNMKLKLVGLDGYQDFYPSEISGGMKKRAGLARALALDPDIVYFDEPSAGLDPVSSKQLDDLILNINQSFGTTIVVVSHELASIFTIANNSIFLSKETQSILARGNPHELLKNPPNEQVYEFLTRGKKYEKNTK